MSNKNVKNTQPIARWEIDVETGKVYLSEAAAEYFNAASELACVEDFLEFFIEEDRELALSEILRVRHISNEVFFEVRLRLPSGQLRRIEIRLDKRKEKSSSQIYLLGTAVDVSERKEQEIEAIRLAYFDPLTNLPNRLLLSRYLEQAIHVSQKQGLQIAAINIDLDLFSRINQGIGHQAGDEVLRQAAKRLSSLACFGLAGVMQIWDQLSRSISSSLDYDGDLVASMGGDSFVVVLVGVRHHDPRIAAFAEKVQNLLARPFYVQGRELFTSASIGVAISGQDLSPEVLLQQADIAMHEVKQAGRNSIVHFRGEFVAKAAELLSMQSDLRLAMKRNEFKLHYQPKVNLDDSRVVGFEALIRWEHPARGFVSPELLIRLSEETGQIVELGEWVLREACVQIMNWHKQGLTRGTMAVNVSPRQLRDVDFIQRVDRVLEDVGIDGRLLEIEITENVLVTDETSIENIKHLRRRGISIALDDFGTGYSSMSYLLDFPFDTLKIDRSFVKDIQSDKGKAAIVSALATLSHKLDIKVVAEGVENQNELESVRKLNCDQVQGYFICKPKPAEALEHWMRKQKTQGTLRIVARPISNTG